MVDTTDEWIRERTGISERRISTEGETLAYMSKQAALDVLEQTQLSPEDIDVIVLATATPDRLLPATACDLQAELGATNAAAFDIGAACCGFIYGLSVAEGMIASEQATNILVVGGERLSRIVNYEDRSTCILAQGTSPLDRVRIARDYGLITRIEVGDDSYVLIIAGFSTTAHDLLHVKTYNRRHSSDSMISGL